MVEKIFTSTHMKIRHLILLLCFASIAISWWESSTADCEYLNESSGKRPVTETSSEQEKKTAFQNLYPYNVCVEVGKVDKEVEEYIQWIKDWKKKTLVEAVYDVGSTLCREDFCEIEKETFYSKYITACQTAYDETLEDTFQVAITFDENKWFIGTKKCEEKIDSRLRAYKDAAMEEVARNLKDIIEWSSDEYLAKAHEVFDTVADKFNNFLLKFGEIARSFEAFTGRAFV